MSRNKKTNAIVTPRQKAKIGTRVIRDGEPVALVGPENRKDTLSASEFVEQLYGPGYHCAVIPPVSQTK